MAAKKLKDYMNEKKSEVKPLTAKLDADLLEKFQALRKKNNHRLKDTLEAALMMYIEENS